MSIHKRQDNFILQAFDFPRFVACIPSRIQLCNVVCRRCRRRGSYPQNHRSIQTFCCRRALLKPSNVQPFPALMLIRSLLTTSIPQNYHDPIPKLWIQTVHKERQQRNTPRQASQCMNLFFISMKQYRTLLTHMSGYLRLTDPSIHNSTLLY